METAISATYNWAYEYNHNQPHAPSHVGDRSFNYDANGNLTSWIHDNSKATRFMQWDDENRLQKVTEANSITRFKYDDQGQRKVKFHHKPNSGTGKETIYINQFYNVSNRAIS
ncbi:MAG: RHS repeat protein, partial [Gammaproteobacteria bacterium]|nr:RHS repeat protein [Gammaproteobacteria bacterium]